MSRLRTIPPWWANPIVILPVLTLAALGAAFFAVGYAAGVLK